VSLVFVRPSHRQKKLLLNALAGAEVAIVTPIAGTTRDKVSQ
jgi:tRNA modification GTPase